jgi:hypothetical protein
VTQVLKLVLLVTGAIILPPACQPPAPGLPALADEKLARIMADLYVAEAATTGLSGYEKDSLSHVYYAQVFELHGVTQADYQTNLERVSGDERHIGRVVKQAIEFLKPEKK